MKKTICVLLVALQSIAYCQLNKETFKVYKVEIKAIDVAGQSKFLGNGVYNKYTSLLQSPQIIMSNSDFLYDLGRYRVDFNTLSAGMDPLFNLSSDRENYPLLDAIDFDFYRSYGIDKVLKARKDLKDDVKLKKIRSLIQDSSNTSISRKKQILFSQEFDEIRDLIIYSRFDTLASPFTLEKSKVNITTAELKAGLKDLVTSNSVTLTAQLKSYLENLADYNVKVSGVYYIANFDKDYIARIQHHFETITTIDAKNDLFAKKLKEYTDPTKSQKFALNAQLAALKLNGTYDKSKINTTSIAATLETEFSIPALKAASIAAGIQAEFKTYESVKVQGSFKNVYILRYFTDPTLDKLILNTVNSNSIKFVE